MISETIYFKPPAGTVSMDAVWQIDGGKVELIRIIDARKQLSVNPDKNKLLVHGGKSELYGSIAFCISVESSRFEFEVTQITCANADAIEIPSDGYYEKRWVYRGVHKRRIEGDEFINAVRVPGATADKLTYAGNQVFYFGNELRG